MKVFLLNTYEKLCFFNFLDPSNQKKISSVIAEYHKMPPIRSGFESERAKKKIIRKATITKSAFGRCLFLFSSASWIKGTSQKSGQKAKSKVLIFCSWFRSWRLFYFVAWLLHTSSYGAGLMKSTMVSLKKYFYFQNSN